MNDDPLTDLSQDEFDELVKRAERWPSEVATQNAAAAARQAAREARRVAAGLPAQTDAEMRDEAEQGRSKL